MLAIRRSDINHVQRIVCVRSEAYLPRQAAREGRRARILGPDVHGVRNLVFVVPAAACFTISCAVYVSRVVIILVLLYELLGMKVPKAHLAIV